MQKYLLLGIMTIIFVAFQNCAKKDLSDLQSEADAKVVTKTSEDLSAFKPASAESISFVNSLDGISFSAASKTLPQRDMDVYKYSVDVESGIISGLDINEEKIASKSYCLREEEMAELKAILDTAKMCGAVEPADENVACTMIYSEPYASMAFSDRVFALGEATSGCSKSADLCGSHSDLLKSFLKSLILDMPSRACSFEAL